MRKSGGHQENPDWDRPEDRVWKDQTEAIRSKYQGQRMKGGVQTKCPNCHGNFSSSEYRVHKTQCIPGLNPRTNPPAQQKTSKSSLASILVLLNAAEVKCKHCNVAVLNEASEMRKHLQQSHPLLPTKRLMQHFCL
jgi:hypothetical protein